MDYLSQFYPETRDPGKTNPHADLAAARTYLAELAQMCKRAAHSADPREVWLAVGLAEKRCGERIRRNRETYSLECHGCRCDIEIPVSERHCPHCHAPLEIQWRPFADAARVRLRINSATQRRNRT